MSFSNSTPKVATVLKPGFAIMVFFITFSCFSLSTFAQVQHADYEVEKKLSLLERAHKGFYDLGYSQEYVRDVVMPEIRKERQVLASHFPERRAGADSKSLFVRWISEYPQEYENYMGYLRKQHVKLRTNLSNQ